MAIYTNLKAVERQLHGLFESSKLLSTDVGDLYDVIVRDGLNKEIAVDNGVAIKLGNYTGNGLQERYATIAAVGDKIAVIGTPANVKTALNVEQGQPYNFTNPAGKPAKAYQIQDADVHTDIFGIASYQFTDDSSDAVKVGAYVIVDGNGAYVAQEEAPNAGTYGFIGKIHSISVGTYFTVVRVQVVQNKQIA